MEVSLAMSWLRVAVHFSHYHRKGKLVCALSARISITWAIVGNLHTGTVYLSRLSNAKKNELDVITTNGVSDFLCA